VIPKRLFIAVVDDEECVRKPTRPSAPALSLAPADARSSEIGGAGLEGETQPTNTPTNKAIKQKH